MRAVPGFQKAQALLRMEGCSYRLREVARSPFAYVDEVDPPQRQQVARCCRIQDDEACERLTELLLEAGKNRAAGGRGLDWDCLSRALGKPSADPTASTSHTLTGRAQGTGPQPLRLLPGQGGLLIGAACLAWGIDNNLSQRLSLRNPLQISLLKALGASVPMLLLSMGLGQRFPAGPTLWAALAIGAVGYGLSIWLDLLALRELGAAREAVVFATAPFVGVVFAVLVLREAFTIPQALASLLMVVGVGVLLRGDHTHRHYHAALRHAHRHHHGSAGGDPHHSHDHREDELPTQGARWGFWHAHEHLHEPIDHEHPHVSDAHQSPSPWVGNGGDRRYGLIKPLGTDATATTEQLQRQDRHQ
jgi:uncharacterized membrane protein